MVIRTCKKCKQEKEINHFQETDPFGKTHRWICKECKNEYLKQRRDNDPNVKHRKIPKPGFLFCSKCKQELEISNFFPTLKIYRNRSFSYYCKNCESLRKKLENLNPEYREKGLERRRAYDLIHEEEERKRKLLHYYKTKDTIKYRLYRQKRDAIRRERNREQINTISANDIEFLLLFQENICAKCGKVFDTANKYSLDHIKPLSKGGNLVLENVQLLCKGCNSSKGNKEILYRKTFENISSLYTEIK